MNTSLEILLKFCKTNETLSQEKLSSNAEIGYDIHFDIQQEVL